jgi:hypothetical protein
MDRLKWIDSAGGPLVLISDKSFKLWSGIFKRSSYLKNKFEEADDFMNAHEADYGKACEIQDYLGVIDIGNDFALVLGDEPMLTTVLSTKDKKVIVARLAYADDKNFVDEKLRELAASKINDWQLSVTFDLSSDKQFLFDSAADATMLEKEEGTYSYLSLNILQGQYSIWTSTYNPDDKTKLIIHKFELKNRPF